MSQYLISDNQLILQIKKPVLFLRVFLFSFSTLVLVGPIIGVIISLATGADFHIMHIVSLGFAGAIGYLGWRFSLWNAFGREIYQFESERIVRTTDFKLFKEKKVFKIQEGNFNIESLPIGYIEDEKGLMIINADQQKIQSSVRLPLEEIEEIKNSMSLSRS